MYNRGSGPSNPSVLVSEGLTFNPIEPITLRNTFLKKKLRANQVILSTKNLGKKIFFSRDSSILGL